MQKLNSLKQLNPKQKEATMQTKGPVLVIAGAGSGKTKVLTHRVAYIVEQNLATPNEILTVTFTNKAANELKNRINDLLNNNLKLTWTGTFHSICAKILRIEGHLINLDTNYTIFDPDDQAKLMNEVLKELHREDESKNRKLYLNMISKAKRYLVTPQNFTRNFPEFYTKNFEQIYALYQKKLEEQQAVDFDDLIMKTIALLTKNKDIQEKYSQKFKYILIDEFQDTNYSQYTLIKNLLNTEQNLFVVGDDAQSIYKWRGADLTNILNFKKDFPEAKIIKLEQNYRSTKIILDATNQIIKNNVKQMNKNLWTENETGELIKIFVAENEYKEAEYIAKKILDENIKDCAILYRTNAQSRVFEETFLTYNIPYKLIGAIRFYQRKEIKDIIAYLRLLVNSQDNVSFKRIINLPKRGIGITTVNKLVNIAQEKNISLLNTIHEKFLDDSNFSINTKQKLLDFKELIQTLKTNLASFDLIEFLEYLLKETKLLDQYKEKTNENINKIENIKEFISIATKYKDKDAKESLKLFLEEISLLEEGSQEKTRKEQDKNIILMTIHASKGLEFDTVFVAGLEQNLFPHSRSFSDPEEMEEERRLAYVAFTRARQKLILTYSKQRTLFGTYQSTTPSQFIKELPDNLLEYENQDLDLFGFEEITEDTTYNSLPQIRVGEKVKSPFFGIGTVLEITEDAIKVRFIEHGIKELAPEYARLEKLSF